MTDTPFRAMVVEEVADGDFSRRIQTRKISDLPKGEVLIKADYSSLNITVYPFILRGTAIIGIDSATTELDTRLSLWRDLVGRWKFSGPASLATTIGLEEIDHHIEKILKSRQMGRKVVDLNP